MILSSHAPPSSCKITGVVRSSNRWPEGVSNSTYKQNISDESTDTGLTAVVESVLVLFFPSK